MENEYDMDTGPLWSLLKSLLTFTILCVVGLVLYVPMEKYISGWGGSKYTEEQLNEWTNKRMDADSGPEVVDGIHIASGMVYDENFDVVKATCTSCHSSKLIIQNRATREGWKDMIVWMHLLMQPFPQVSVRKSHWILAMQCQSVTRFFI